MGNGPMTKKQLSDELTDLRKKLTKLQRAEAKHKELEQRFAERAEQLEADIRQLQDEITEHRKIEKSLIESERLYRNIVVQSKDAIFTANQNGAIIYANPACESIFGYSPGEFISDSSLVIRTLHSDYQQQFNNFWSEYKVNNIFPEEMTEWIRIHKEGHTVYTENYFSKVFDDTGDIIGFQIVVRDITERKLTAVRLNLQYNITHILSESINISEAMQKILYAICENGRWVIGEIWLTDKDNNVLCLDSIWNKPLLDISEFEAISKKITFQKGKGLPGCVWESGHPAWFTDVILDKNFLRESAALKIGLHGAFAFPIKGSDGVKGVLTFFSRDKESPDDNMLQMFDAIGSQIGNFIERKKVEENLRTINQELQALINASPMAIITLDSEKRITLWSRAAENIFGWTKDEIIGKPVPFIPEDKRVEFQSYVNRVFNGEVLANVEIVRRKKDGSMVYASLSAAPIFDDKGNFNRLMAVIEDITERKRIQENIIREKNLFQTLIESLPGVFVLIDNKGNMLRWNTHFEHITGYSADEIIKMNSLDFGSKADRDMIKQKMEEVFTKGSSTVNEVALVTKSGREIPYYYTGMRIIIDNIPCLIGIGIDISDRKQAENAIRIMEKDLLMAKKLESIGVLAGGIAHDFNNLLTAVLGNVSLAKRFVKPSDRAYERLSIAEDACYSAKELSYRLLTFSKGGEPLRQPVLISKLVKETVDSVLANANIRCECNIPDDLYMVKIDEQQIKQVILNLTKNAIESSSEKIRVYARNINVSSKDKIPINDGNYIRLSIEDNGRGIAEENLSKIFDPYFSTKEMGSEKGMGLGLSICYSIVKRHEGLITVDSKAGEGATFHVYIPAYESKFAEGTDK